MRRADLALSAAVWLLGGGVASMVVRPTIRNGPPLQRRTPAFSRMSVYVGDGQLLPDSVSVQLALTAAEWSKAGIGSTRESPADIPAEFMIWGLGSISLLVAALLAAVIFKVRQAGLADEAAAQAIESVTEALAANEQKKERTKKKTKKARRDNR